MALHRLCATGFTATRFYHIKNSWPNGLREVAGELMPGSKNERAFIHTYSPMQMIGSVDVDRESKDFTAQGKNTQTGKVSKTYEVHFKNWREFNLILWPQLFISKTGASLTLLYGLKSSFQKLARV